MRKNFVNNQEELNKAEKRITWDKALFYGLFPLLLFVMCVLPINRGIDVSDTMYSLSSDVLFLKASGDWTLFMAYYLANFVGFIFTKLPFGHTLIGMNFYTSMVLFASAMLVYVYFGRRKQIPYPVLFLGELVAISFHWCPTTVLYNFFSYLLWIIAFLLLRNNWDEVTIQKKGEKGIFKDCFLAGTILGINVFTKFPNITAALMILLVFYYAFLTKEKSVTMWKKVGCCVAGFMVGFLALFVWMEAFYGIGTYGKMVQSLFAMTDTATDYKSDSMISAILQYYTGTLFFLFGILVFVIAGIVCYRIACKLDEKKKSSIFSMLFKVGYVLAFMVLIRFFYGRGLFGIDYRSDFAVIFIGTLIAWFVIIIAMTTMIQKKASVANKVDALLILLILVITPLGSNNGIYPVLNNYYLVLPVAIHLGMQLYAKMEKKEVKLPLKLVAVCFLIFSIVQGVLFTTHFTFKGQDDGTKCDTRVEDNSVLQGMKTNQERKENLTGILCETEIVLEQTKEKNLLTYGNLPGMFFLLEDSQPVLSTTWPDLDSYACKNMKAELEKIRRQCQEGKKEPPVILFSRDAYLELLEEKTEKEVVLKEFMDSLEYDMMFENEYWCILTSS